MIEPEWIQDLRFQITELRTALERKECEAAELREAAKDWLDDTEEDNHMPAWQALSNALTQTTSGAKMLRVLDVAKGIRTACYNTGNYGNLGLQPGKCTCGMCELGKALAKFDAETGGEA